jgi:hypothetical protein
VAAICVALDGLPLALELAASRCRVLSLAQIQEQLSTPLSIGERALRDLPDRQQTLHATIGWSYELLSAPAQRALRAAGAFLGGFTPAALDAVCGGSSAAELEELHDASLLRRHTDAGRFEPLELVRAFALEELERAGEAVEARGRHRRYFAKLVTPVRAEFEAGVAPGELAAPLVADQANLRVAFTDALDSGDQETAVALALGMPPLWISGNLAQESREVTERLLERFEVSGAEELALLRVVAALEEPADKWQRRFAQRAAELGDMESLGIATMQSFAEAVNTGNREERLRLRPVLQELISSDASPRVLGWVNYSLWGDAYIEGRFEEAYEHACEGVRIAEELGHEYMRVCVVEARLLAGSAVSGEIPQPDLAEVIELARRQGIHSLVLAALWLVARYAAGVEPEGASRWLALAERILIELGAGYSAEDSLRDETMAVLGIEDLAPLVAGLPPVDPATALAEAAAWLRTRSSSEVAPRPDPLYTEP